MTIQSANTLQIAIYEGPGSQAMPQDLRFELMRTLLEKGYAVNRITDAKALCASQTKVLLVLGHFNDRESAPLCDPNGNGNGAVEIILKDVGGSDVAGILEQVESVRQERMSAKPG